MKRLTTRTSIMGRKHDLAFGLAFIWRKKLKHLRYDLIENAVDKLGAHEDLEEEIGCPLEIRCMLETDQYIFDKYGEPYQIKTFYKNFFVARYRGKQERLEGFGYYNVITDFPYSDYKKNWWLKRDGSE